MSLKSPPFVRFLFALRRAGVPVGVGEWMSLMEALASGAVSPGLNDFYHAARAMLIKTESHFDTYDQVFSGVFADGTLPASDLSELLSWLKNPIAKKQLSPEDIKRLEALDLEELRKRFEERLKEQTERHDGGSRWIGTGGTSPFGHGGTFPGGVRVGGSGGGRSAAQIASARNFRMYRDDRVLDTRDISVALKKLRRLSRKQGAPELAIEETIEAIGKNGGELELVFQPPRENQAKVVLLMDVGGSMDPFAELVETVFSAASRLNHWKRFDAYAFHNCPYNVLEHTDDHRRSLETERLLREADKETFLIIVGDAHMAPSELLDTWGAIDYYTRNDLPGLVWLHRLREKFPRSIWLNPIEEKSWYGWTIRAVAQVFSMFPLTVDGLNRGVGHLLQTRSPPLKPLATLFPDLGFEQTDAQAR